MLSENWSLCFKFAVSFHQLFLKEKDYHVEHLHNNEKLSRRHNYEIIIFSSKTRERKRERERRRVTTRMYVKFVTWRREGPFFLLLFFFFLFYLPPPPPPPSSAYAVFWVTLTETWLGCSGGEGRGCGGGSEGGGRGNKCFIVWPVAFVSDWTEMQIMPFLRCHVLKEQKWHRMCHQDVLKEQKWHQMCHQDVLKEQKWHRMCQHDAYLGCAEWRGKGYTGVICCRAEWSLLTLSYRPTRFLLAKLLCSPTRAESLKWKRERER